LENSNFKWCIENDFQVYIKPYGKYAKIAIRRGGISACGKDVHYDKQTGNTYYSSENEGTVMYKTHEKAMEKLPEVYEYLRKKYGV
jgi:hypothetical protein